MKNAIISILCTLKLANNTPKMEEKSFQNSWMRTLKVYILQYTRNRNLIKTTLLGN